MVNKKVLKLLMCLLGMIAWFYALDVLAADKPAFKDLNDMITHVGSTLHQIARLFLAISSISGFGLVIASIFKFKQHKDNPQQIPMGTPITMLCVGIALIFVANFIQPIGQTLFGGVGQGNFTGGSVNVINMGGGS